MSGLWVVPDDGGVLHYVPAGAERLDYNVYRRGPALRANGPCLCSRVRPGEEVTAQRRGTPAIRCRTIAARRAIPPPLPPMDWAGAARRLARYVVQQAGVPGDVLDAAFEVLDVEEYT